MIDKDFEKVAERIEIDGNKLSKYSDLDLKTIALELLTDSGVSIREIDEAGIETMKRADLIKSIVSNVVKAIGNEKGEKVDGGYKLECGGRAHDSVTARDFLNELQSI